MSKVFIVIEPDPVVCMDVEGLLGSRYPDALVWASASLQANARQGTGGPDTTFFVKGSLVKGDTKLADTLRNAVALGSKVVTIGIADGLNTSVTTLDMPFTTDMVIAAVEIQTPG